MSNEKKQKGMATHALEEANPRFEPSMPISDALCSHR